MNKTLIGSALLGLLTPAAAADIFWVGSVSNDIFDEANWDLTSSSVTTIDPNISVDDNVVIANAPNTVEIPDVSGQQRFQVGEGFTLTVDNSAILGLNNDGIGGQPSPVLGVDMLVINGGTFDMFFIVNDVRLDVDSTVDVTFGGGGAPVNGSTVNMTFGATVRFRDETVAAFTTEHLSKFSVDGNSAVIGGNIDVVSDGAMGCIVTVIPSLVGSSFCGPAVVNSAGLSAIIEGSGSAVAAANDLTLIASDMPQNQFAYFLNSLSPGFVPNPGGSQGNLCLSGGIGRYNATAGVPVGNSGTTGSITLTLDLPNTPSPMGFVSITAGTSVSFQCWYRDLNPTPTSNFTDGLTVMFQ